MISTGVAQSICGQAQEFSRTQSIQPPQKKKPTSSPSIPCGWLKFRKCPPGGKWNRGNQIESESIYFKKKLNLLGHSWFVCLKFLKVEWSSPVSHSHPHLSSTVTRSRDQKEKEPREGLPGLWVGQRQNLMLIHLQ